MKLSGECTFLGTERKTKKDGGTYVVVGLLQGLDSNKLFLDDSMIIECEKIKPNQIVHCDFDVTMNGDYNRMSLLSIAPVKTS